MLSKFNRNNLIKKEQGGNKTANLTIVNDKCFIYDHFVEGIVTKSAKFTPENLIGLVTGLIEVSRS